MTTFFKSLLSPLKQASNLDNSLYNIREVNGLDTPELSKAINNLNNDVVDGYLVKNALDAEQIKLLRQFNSHLIKQDLTDQEIAGTYPVSFITKMYKREMEESYFQDNEMFKGEIKAITGFDFVEKMISEFNGGKETRIKRIPGRAGMFAPVQFRTLRKGGSNIHVHCENCHQAWAPELNEQLGEHKLQRNAIAYFFTLQGAEGGKIVLFDIKWQEGQSLEKINEDHFKIVHPNGKKTDCSPKGRIKRMEIDTEPGDLFIFNGGKIWHMVDRVTGDQNRITVGGFLNKAEDGEEIWA